MKSDEFMLMVAVSALAALAAAFSLPNTGLLFGLWLFALPLAGFFALGELGKAGVPSPSREFLFAAAAAVSYFLAAFSLSALPLLSAFAFVPLLLCVPAAVQLGRQAVFG